MKENALDREFKRESQRLRKESKVHRHEKKVKLDIHEMLQRQRRRQWLSDLRKPMFTLVLVENQRAMDEGEFSAFLVRGWKNLVFTYLDLVAEHPKSVVWVFRGCDNALEDIQRHRTVSTEYLLRKMREKHLHDRMNKYC